MRDTPSMNAGIDTTIAKLLIVLPHASNSYGVRIRCVARNHEAGLRAYTTLLCRDLVSKAHEGVRG